MTQMQSFPTPRGNTRIGIQYLPDTLHYRQRDLHAWAPELKSLGVSWVLLQATLQQAIPEYFLTGLLQHQLEPVIHLALDTHRLPSLPDLRLLLRSYANWGVHYIALFDRPNQRASWRSEDWAQADLVSRFMDLFLPLAEEVASHGMFPIFPGLEPGGDYWDTAFFQAAMEALAKRASLPLRERLVVGAYGWADDHAVNWGAGGPERWPGARPYRDPAGEEDQRGFRIFDWYFTLAEAAFGYRLPVLLLGAGTRRPSDDAAAKDLTIARLLAGEPLLGLDQVPPEVLAGCFSRLAVRADGLDAAAWYRPDGTTRPVVAEMKTWRQRYPAKVYLAPKALPTALGKHIPENTVFDLFPEAPGQPLPSTAQAKGEAAHGTHGTRPIRHYVLLPVYEWGVTDWHLDVVRGFIKKYRPTVGFSIDEACQAAQVTIVGGEAIYNEEVVQMLRTAGCKVVRIQGDGTSIATQLNQL